MPVFPEIKYVNASGFVIHGVLIEDFVLIYYLLPRPLIIDKVNIWRSQELCTRYYII